MVSISLNKETLETICRIVKDAGEVIMPIYRKKDIDVEQKVDGEFVSPLTEADTAAHELIVKELATNFPDTPVLSEEDADVDYETRRSWDEYWLVDPLDGTKEFIKKSDEFTVNIALIRNKQPVLGVVYAPALDVMYFGANGIGAKKSSKGKSVKLPVEKAEHNPLVVVVSKSHFTDETKEFLDKVGNYEAKSIGSSLKLCLVAEGTADFYPRLGPTMEWDVGAGDAIVRASGGQVVTYPDMKQFTYSKKDLRNGYFLASSSATSVDKLL